MTANKILNIGKASVKISWALVMLLATVLFIIVSGFFKIFVTVAELGSNEEGETSFATDETSWDMEHPFASGYEKNAAKMNGEWW